MQHFAVTFFSFPDCTYETSTCFADSATPLFRARTAVELRRSRTGEFAGGVYGDAELEGLADCGGFHTGADAAPECGVEQNHVDGGIEDIGGELLEVDHHGVGGERYAHHFAGAAHTVEAVDRILQVIVAQALDGLAEADGLFGGPYGVGVEAVGVAGEFGG